MPACVYNNTSGDADDAVRRSFKEPSWNNPVVRIIEHDKRDVVPRLDRKWSVHALATEMVRALEKRSSDVPDWLKLFAAEQRAHATKVDTAIFGMA